MALSSCRVLSPMLTTVNPHLIKFQISKGIGNLYHIGCQKKVDIFKKRGKIELKIERSAIGVYNQLSKGEGNEYK